jgi:rRNA pseudouridine-1189 N-methylase Emg1 (Nep1/Mra1 family)
MTTAGIWDEWGRTLQSIDQTSAIRCGALHVHAMPANLTRQPRELMERMAHAQALLAILDSPLNKAGRLKATLLP